MRFSRGPYTSTLFEFARRWQSKAFSGKLVAFTTTHRDRGRSPYAHIVAESFAEAAHNITDRLVNNMGFNPYEAANLFISQQFPLPLPDGQARTPRIPDCYIPLSLCKLNCAVKAVLCAALSGADTQS